MNSQGSDRGIGAGWLAVAAALVLAVTFGGAADAAAPLCKYKGRRNLCDGGGTSTLNSPPTISGTPSVSVLTGSSYSFLPSATDANGDALTFAIVNRPAWASFSTSTGRLSGTPTSSNVGEYIDIRISVSDGQATAALAPFSIAVNQANRAPVISGTPATSVVETQSYLFRPSATDADGNALVYSILNRPAWASFNTASGALSGTPPAGSAGTYANITIRVSDGQLTASLPAFSIAVQQVATGSATLSWQPPTTRSDGSPLLDLAGYRIRYGTAVGNYPNVVQLPNAGLTTAVIENLARATWYFVATAYDSSGAESSFSGVVSKTIN
ncbi:MAG: hypothetical protein FJ191_04430 [Gammaproteobacteria bacterium]|nr:hypothetical protein [Gammaproteobacteria bacterium]